MSVASHPAHGSPSCRPKTTSSRKPASGRAGINQTASSTELTPQQGDVVGGGTGLASEDGDDDPEADHDLGCGDDEHERHDDLAADVVQHPGERDEREVDGVEH